MTNIPRGRGGQVSTVRQIMTLAAERPTASVVKEKLAGLVKRTAEPLDLPNDFEPASPGVALDLITTEMAASQAAVAHDKMQRTLRSLSSFSEAGETPAATALANEVLRHYLTGTGWEVVERSLQANAEVMPPAVAGVLSTLKAAEQEPVSLLRIAKTVDAQFEPSLGAAGQEAPSLQAPAARAVVDALTSIDPGYGGAMRERLASGSSVSDVAGSVWERKRPLADVLSSSVARGDEAQAGAKVAGLVFDLGTNTWVQKDRSWTYDVSLRQLLEYQVSYGGKTIVDGPSDVAARLHTMSRDPLTNTSSLVRADIDSFLADLATVASSEKSAPADALLNHGFELTFSTANGGDVPVGASWSLPDALSGRLLTAMTDHDFVGALHATAEELRATEKAALDARLAPLKELLEQYPGVAVRHKRAHGALINLNEKMRMGFAQATGKGGPISRDSVYMTPAQLAEKFADAKDLKVRFLFNEGLELGVISDQQFKFISETFGFPPNHEFLAMGSKIPGSGYLTIDAGKIVAIHDDTILEPGKLPYNLPPALDVLRLRGFAIDEAKVASAKKALNWELFKEQKAHGARPFRGPPSASVESLKAYFEGLPPTESPVEIFSWVQSRMAALKAEGLDAAQVHARAVSDAAQVLSGFAIGGVSAKDFRPGGGLPTHLNDYSDLSVSEELASSIVRMATV